MESFMCAPVGKTEKEEGEVVVVIARHGRKHSSPQGRRQRPSDSLITFSGHGCVDTPPPFPLLCFRRNDPAPLHATPQITDSAAPDRNQFSRESRVFRRLAYRPRRLVLSRLGRVRLSIPPR